MCIIAVVERLGKPDREKEERHMYARGKDTQKENVCASDPPVAIRDANKLQSSCD